MDDYILPPKCVKKGQVMKKQKKFVVYEMRYLLLGCTQLLIARDKEFTSILNVVPIEGGYTQIKKFGNNNLEINTLPKKFYLKFETYDDMEEWHLKLQAVASKEVKMKSYQKRVHEQDTRLADSHRIGKYRRILTELEVKLKELTEMHKMKQKFEIENSKDEDFREYITRLYKNNNLEQTSLTLAKVIIGSNFSKQEFLIPNEHSPNLQKNISSKSSDRKKRSPQTAREPSSKNYKSGVTFHSQNTLGKKKPVETQVKDNEEFVAHVEGNEEILIMGKTKKFLKWPINDFPKHKVTHKKKLPSYAAPATNSMKSKTSSPRSPPKS
eukprot:CAMPEP_0170551644 /NCGR_PEP_ID=MMETSP0211-20121228/9657_1 /TAXON_ID=311385 /ORGANISM="Pseudokeronopsis sp., Strain OXSARD2" /LENGTH=324 /DNA_ID=CAMNT_0010858959 /DNA_START=227 /DNA_END=1199 /DNA_ORIENTATION=-